MLNGDSVGLVSLTCASGQVLRPRHRKVVQWRYTASGKVWARYHPDRGLDLTWYDLADRPIAIQDARQRVEGKISLKYDGLSRPVEGGVARLSASINGFGYADTVALNTDTVWDRFEQVYDTAVSGSPIPVGHFRGRVTTHRVWQEYTGSADTPDYVVYYDYDLMGRVKREVHEVPMLRKFRHHVSEVSYVYDVVSGKVRAMVYNPGKRDQFIHRFVYDAMGNLKEVWTSRDSVHWVLESRLWYYPDGKLRRREIRPLDLFLQGMDYAYMFDGWLKAINAEVLANDPGRDGFIVGNDTSYYARDVFSLMLRYYPNDYRPIKPGVPSLEASINSGGQHLFKPYYTGWISSWSLWLDTLHTAYSFRYDQMGRLTRARTLSGFTGAQWDAALVNRYSTSYRYDLAGNILSLVRYDGLGNLLDSLRYDYYDLTLNNRLKSISDAVVTQFPHDLESQPSVNYLYDPVGNMVRDVSRNLSVIYNYANRPKLLTLGNETIRMFYNPAGYRFFKGTADKGDIFIYNTQGQLMAKYSVEGDTLRLDFLPIYEGTRRLGIYEPEGVEWVAGSGRLSLLPNIYVLPYLNCPMQLRRVRRYALKPTRKYELTDHLGNVRVVIADQRMAAADSSGQVVAYYKPKIVGIYDYCPFGWMKPLAVGSYPFTYQGHVVG